MIPINDEVSISDAELHFEFTRAGGPGGQNVNKVESRVTVVFDVPSSRSLTDGQKALIVRKLKHRIDRKGTLRVSDQRSRSQWENRQGAVRRLAMLLASALVVVRHRVASRPTSTSRQRRHLSKTRRSKTKQLRRRVSPDN